MPKNPSLEAHVCDSLIELIREPTPEMCAALGEEVARHKVSVCYVSDPFKDYSALRNVSLGAVTANFLATHEERDVKDECGLILADLVGHRRDAYADSASGIAYDIDGWRTFDPVVEQRERLGLFGATWTTYSHWKNESETDANAALDWRKGIDPRAPFTDDQLRAYFDANKRRLGFYKAVRVLHGGWPVKVRRRGKDVHVYQFTHAPVSKLRTMFFFDESLPIPEIGKDGCKAIYRFIGDREFPEHWDETCCNVGRIHYLPAHRPGAPHDLEIHGGHLLKWRPIWEQIKAQVVTKRIEVRKHAATRLLMPSNADLAELAHHLRFVSPDIGRKDWCSVLSAIHNETNGSDDGRALAHSWSAGSPEKYDDDALDAYWAWLGENAGDGKGYRIGTIVWMAKQNTRWSPYRRTKPPLKPLPGKAWT